MATPQGIQGVYATPTSYKDALENVLGEAGAIYGAKKTAGYQTYPGQRIAGFSPEEQAAMTGIAGLVGAGQQYFDPAAQLYTGTARQFDATTAQQYMNPYQQAVIDVEKREAMRQFDPVMQDISAKAASTGSFGGSRQAVLESEAIRNQQQQLQDIQTRGQKAAYDTAQRAFESQLAREAGAARGLAGLGTVAPGQALKEFTALSGIGEAQRGMTQQGLDMAYQDFLAQQQYPYDILNQYQASVYGYPYQAYQQTQFDTKSKPSAFQNLAGILGAGAKIGSGFGFFNTGGRVAFRSQGGLSGMVQTMADGMSVGSSQEDVDASDIDTRSMLLKALLNSQKSLTSYSEEAQKALQERQQFAEEEKARLEKQTSPVNYLSDLLIGYSQADPEAGIGQQLGESAQYADALREQALSEVQQIQQDLAAGRISQAEADLKLKQAQVTLVSELNDVLTPTDYTKGLVQNKFTEFAKNSLGVTAPKVVTELVSTAVKNIQPRIDSGELKTEEAQQQAVMDEMKRLRTSVSAKNPADKELPKDVEDANMAATTDELLDAFETPTTTP